MKQANPVGVLLVTHGQLGQYLVDTVIEMINRQPLPVEALEVHNHQDPDKVVARTRAAIERLDAGAGVLMLTDAYGSTPSNIANRAAEGLNVKVIAGVNLPMLVRIFNYPELDLEQLADCAVQGGRAGVVNCDEQSPE